MWRAIDAVREGRAQAVVSCGNTGALMAVSMLRLRKAEGVNRPAIACYWPLARGAGVSTSCWTPAPTSAPMRMTC